MSKTGRLYRSRKEKLRTYSTFKTDIKIENYLDFVLLNFKVRRCYSQFRPGVHDLEIEMGRYRPRGGGHFNFICTGVCGHKIGKLTHPQTKAGTKIDPFSDYLQ